MLPTNSKYLATKCSVATSGRVREECPARGMGEHYTLSIGDLDRAIEADAACIEKQLHKIRITAAAGRLFLLMNY